MLFAYDHEDNRIFIDDTHSNSEYYCPYCGAPLITKKGEIIQHHFAHKSHRLCSDSWERERSYDISPWHNEWQNNFPREKIEFDIFDIFLFMFYGFVLLSGLLSFVLLMLYRKKIGKFKQEAPITDNYIEADYEYNTEEIEEKSEEELMQEAYADYHNGKITEQELNNRLRNIWWSNKDD